METDTGQLAKALWNYLQIKDPLQKADAIVACGGMDLRVAEWGTDLLKAGWTDLIIMSGGVGRLTPPEWKVAEAIKFTEVAKNAGVPLEKILVEDRSTNTRQNIQFSWEKLQQQNIKARSLIFVIQPFIQRRAKALVRKMTKEGILTEFNDIFPECPIKYEDYTNKIVSHEELVNLLVGEVQRLKQYPHRGYIMPQNVPVEISQNTARLIALGYTKYAL